MAQPIFLSEAKDLVVVCSPCHPERSVGSFREGVRCAIRRRSCFYLSAVRSPGPASRRPLPAWRRGPRDRRRCILRSRCRTGV